MKVVVTGGRDFTNASAVYRALYQLHARHPVTLLIEGGARGADRLARMWAQAEGIEVRTFEADWDRFGKSAGYRRNRQMLDEGAPHILVAFPGGKGTADMRKQAAEFGVTTWVPYPNL